VAALQLPMLAHEREMLRRSGAEVWLAMRTTAAVPEG
jgi:hypothetical protein